MEDVWSESVCFASIDGDGNYGEKGVSTAIDLTIKHFGNHLFLFDET